MTAIRHHWFFDFDGTLCDTERDIKAAWRASFRTLGLECPQFDSVYRTGPSLQTVLRQLYPERIGDSGFLDAFLGAFRSHYDNSTFEETVPYPGIAAWLSRLKDEGCTLYIATNKRLCALRRILEKLGWANGVFADLYGPDRTPGVQRTKPDFLADALRERGIAAADAVMVGDTKGDVDAGRANGMWTIACTWGYGTREELAEADEIRERI